MSALEGGGRGKQPPPSTGISETLGRMEAESTREKGRAEARLKAQDVPVGELRRKQSGAAELVPRAQVPVARHSRNRGHAQPTQRWPAALLASAREMADESGFSLDDMSPAERDEFLGDMAADGL